jgi:hypothetical protein
MEQEEQASDFYLLQGLADRGLDLPKIQWLEA